MARVVVAGGGFGGIATAVALRERLDAGVEIVLVDRHDTFLMGLRKTWVVTGSGSLADGTRRLDRVAGVRFVHGTIERVAPQERAVVVDGTDLEADALVLALGADRAPSAVPGLAEHGIDVWDPAQSERGRAALESFEGGRLAIGVFGTPYPCPPGPYELALLAHERLEARGVSANVEVFAPTPISLPIAGPAECTKLDSVLAEAGIEFVPAHMATEVLPGTVRFANGAERPYDLLLAVPPHRVPAVLIEAGLAEAGGWVKVNPRTLETAAPDVYAIGDATAIMLANGLPLPKAGLLAEQEGVVVADRIAARLRGEAPTATFEGEAFCFIEVGNDEAMRVGGRFLDDPPAVEISAPSTDLRRLKDAFERERLERWFDAG
jgi:sulfide:quinone oxidoreductase